jgi:outer membrane protein
MPLSFFRSWLAAALSLTFGLGMAVHVPARAELTEDSLIGPGLRWRPAYDGSASQHTELVPVIRYFGKPWFVRSTQGVLEGGARMALSPGLHLGAQLAYESGRKKSESDFLRNRNVADIDIGASIGAQLEWDHKFGRMPVTFLARARQHTESDRGAQADLRLSAGVFQSGRFAAGVFGQTTWANAKSTGSLYGITPQQSVATGLPVYNAGSGWLFASLGLLWSVELTKTWVVVGSLESRHLRGDAARSPLVERKSNGYVSAGVAYRF